MTALIRLAVLGDCPRVTNLATLAYTSYLERMDKKPAPMLEDYAARIAENRIFVLEIQPTCSCGEKLDYETPSSFSPTIVGFVMLSPGEDALLLNNLAVDPTMQGRGYGKLLVSFAEETACKAGFSQISLYTNEAMTENLQMYPHLGYTETHRATENGFNRVFFSKKL